MASRTSYHKVTGPLSTERAEVLIERIRAALVNLRDEEGQNSSNGKPATSVAEEEIPNGSQIPQRAGVTNDSKTWGGWDWPQGVALTVLYQHSLLQNDSSHPLAAQKPSSMQVAQEWYDAQYEKTDGRGTTKHVNSMAALYCIASLLQDQAIEDEDGRYVRWCREWGEWVMREMPRTREGGLQHIVHDKDNTEQIWADTLFMTVLPLARIGILLDRPEYIQEAAYQFLLHIKYLSDPSTGLWTHAWQFEGRHGGYAFARAFWARGNAWVVYAVPLFLEVAGEVLPEDDPSRRMIVNEYRRLVHALTEVQDRKSGLWHTLLDDPSSYLETSASAAFTAGIFAGIRLGLLDPERYFPMANTALAGVIAEIAPNGEVQHVSGITPIGKDLEYYRNVPTTPMAYGQALAMAALVEWERLFILEDTATLGPTSPISPFSPVTPLSNRKHRFMPGGIEDMDDDQDHDPMTTKGSRTPVLPELTDLGGSFDVAGESERSTIGPVVP